MTLGFDLDHVALAALDTAPALRFLTGALGGTVIFGGQSIGFRPMQVWVGTRDGDGMPVELLEPWEVARNDFLARFVAKHGSGPHHVTFKVTELSFEALTGIDGVGQAPYFAKRAWVSVARGAALSDADLKAYIAASHRMIASKLTRRARAELGLEAL